jgi:hypothetical protein
MMSAEFAAHLSRKYAYDGGSVSSLDEFIEEIAGRSMMSGKPYEVRLTNGKAVDAPEWLRERVAPGAEPTDNERVRP